MTLAGAVLLVLQELKLTEVGLRQHGGVEWFKTVTIANSFKQILKRKKNRHICEKGCLKSYFVYMFVFKEE